MMEQSHEALRETSIMITAASLVVETNKGCITNKEKQRDFRTTSPAQLIHYLLYGLSLDRQTPFLSFFLIFAPDWGAAGGPLLLWR